MSNLIRKRSTRASAVLATAVVSMGILAGPAAAQPEQEGLVNVNISDNEVLLGIGVAANVCNVNVGVIQDNTDAVFDGGRCEAGNTLEVPPGFGENGPGNSGQNN